MNSKLLSATAISLVAAGVAFQFGFPFVGAALIGVFILFFIAMGLAHDN